jgi:hypothetical protein
MKTRQKTPFSRPTLLCFCLCLVFLGACAESDKTSQIRNQNPLGTPGLTSDSSPLSQGMRAVDIDKKAAQASYRKESLQAFKDETTSITPTPLVKWHHDGSINDQMAITHIDRDGMSGRTCGLDAAFETLKERMEDCKKLELNWSGQASAMQGEGNWSLMVRTLDGKEVWYDQRTQLLWSDSLGQSNWCQASGNREIPNELSKINCLAAGQLADFCTNPSNRPLSDEHLQAMGYLDTNLVKWRLPTRNDFFMAETNGLRFIHPSKNYRYWTATIAAENRDQSWIFSLTNGQVWPHQRDQSDFNGEPVHTLCIGRIKEAL